MGASTRIQSLAPYKYRTRENYRLPTTIKGHSVEGAYYRLEENGILSISGCYAWNGTSGPVPDTDRNLGASLVHDVLYQMLREGQLPLSLRHEIDRLFGEHCRALGTPRIIAAVYVWGLRVFGEPFATRPQDEVAPEDSIPMPGGMTIESLVS